MAKEKVTTVVATETYTAESEESRKRSQQELTIADPTPEKAKAAIEDNVVLSNGDLEDK